MNNASTKYKIFLPLVLSLILFSGWLARIDRIFFSRNSSFCIHFLYSSLPHIPSCALSPPSTEELSLLDSAIQQPFYYLSKGTRCFAFVSEDQNYVIKFHRFPSHMRIFSWLNHPFAYRFNARRKNIKAYNLKKLYYNFENYKNSYQDLKEESGLLFVHTNRTDHLKRKVTVIDKTKARYQVPLDDVAFILQKKADLIYPTLDLLYSKKMHIEGKQIISSILHLIVECCQKGYVDNDPMLKKNYGLIGLKAMQIDIGDLVKKQDIEKQENYVPYVKELTKNLRFHLEKDYPELLSHYDEEIALL